MIYYIILFLLTLLSMFDVINPNKKSNKFLFVLVSLFFILMGGLRWETGNDWPPYLNHFETFDYSNLYSRIRFEIGYVNLVRVVHYWTDNYTILLIIISLIVVALKSVTIYRFSNSLFIGLLLYWAFILGDIIAVRQSIAVSICFFSLIFIVKQKKWHFTILVAAASCFHSSAVIFFLAYFIYHRDWSIGFKTGLLCFCMLIGITGGASSIVTLISDTLEHIFPYLARRAEIYGEKGEDLNYSNVSKLTLLVLGIAKRAVVLPFFFYFENKIKNTDPHYRGLLNLFVFGNCIYFLVIDFLSIQRLAGFFYPIEILLFCIIFDFVSKKIPIYIILIIYSTLKLYMLISGAKQYLIPYISIFSENTARIIN